MIRGMRVAFVLGFVLSLGMAASQEPPAAPSLKYLAEGEVDFRACDRDWNTPVDVSPAPDPED